jgi:hypothetical protein
VNSEIASRLQNLDIAWFATEKGYTMFTRGNCAAIGHEQPAGVSLGSSGTMTESGFAYLVWREERAFLVAHGGTETAASSEEVDAIRRFSADLKTALDASVASQS